MIQRKKHDKEKRAQAVEYIKKTVPGYQDMNPFINTKCVDVVKKSLLEFGYYVSSTICDQSVVNILLEAQGKQKQRLNHARRSVYNY